MEQMSIGDEDRDKYVTQHLPQTELVACPHATQNLCSIQTRRTLSIVAFMHSDQNHSTFPLIMLIEYEVSFQIILKNFFKQWLFHFSFKSSPQVTSSYSNGVSTISENFSGTFQQCLSYLAENLAQLKPFSRFLAIQRRIQQKIQRSCSQYNSELIRQISLK